MKTENQPKQIQKHISNQELLEEYVRRATRGEISKDELILAMIKVK